MMERLNVPSEEIDRLINMIEEGKVTEMFEFTAKYDVQKLRKQFFYEGEKEGIEG